MLLSCSSKPEKGKRKRRCRKKYCAPCLQRTYAQTLSTMTSEQIKNWVCPGCLHICTCAACQRRTKGHVIGVDSVAPGAMPMPLGLAGLGGLPLGAVGVGVGGLPLTNGLNGLPFPPQGMQLGPNGLPVGVDPATAAWLRAQQLQQQQQGLAAGMQMPLSMPLSSLPPVSMQQAPLALNAPGGVPLMMQQQPLLGPNGMPLGPLPLNIAGLLGGAAGTNGLPPMALPLPPQQPMQMQPGGGLAGLSSSASVAQPPMAMPMPLGSSSVSPWLGSTGMLRQSQSDGMCTESTTTLSLPMSGPAAAAAAAAAGASGVPPLALPLSLPLALAVAPTSPSGSSTIRGASRPVSPTSSSPDAEVEMATTNAAGANGAADAAAATADDSTHANGAASGPYPSSANSSSPQLLPTAVSITRSVPLKTRTIRGQKVTNAPHSLAQHHHPYARPESSSHSQRSTHTQRSSKSQEDVSSSNANSNSSSNPNSAGAYPMDQQSQLLTALLAQQGSMQYLQALAASQAASAATAASSPDLPHRHRSITSSSSSTGVGRGPVPVSFPHAGGFAMHNSAADLAASSAGNSSVSAVGSTGSGPGSVHGGSSVGGGSLSARSLSSPSHALLGALAGLDIAQLDLSQLDPASLLKLQENLTHTLEARVRGAHNNNSAPGSVAASTGSRSSRSSNSGSLKPPHSSVGGGGHRAPHSSHAQVRDVRAGDSITGSPPPSSFQDGPSSSVGSSQSSDSQRAALQLRRQQVLERLRGLQQAGSSNRSAMESIGIRNLDALDLHHLSLQQLDALVVLLSPEGQTNSASAAASSPSDDNHPQQQQGQQPMQLHHAQQPSYVEDHRPPIHGPSHPTGPRHQTQQQHQQQLALAQAQAQNMYDPRSTYAQQQGGAGGLTGSSSGSGGFNNASSVAQLQAHLSSMSQLQAQQQLLQAQQQQMRYGLAMGMPAHQLLLQQQQQAQSPTASNQAKLLMMQHLQQLEAQVQLLSQQQRVEQHLFDANRNMQPQQQMQQQMQQPYGAQPQQLLRSQSPQTDSPLRSPLHSNNLGVDISTGSGGGDSVAGDGTSMMQQNSVSPPDASLQVHSPHSRRNPMSHLPSIFSPPGPTPSPYMQPQQQQQQPQSLLKSGDPSLPPLHHSGSSSMSLSGQLVSNSPLNAIEKLPFQRGLSAGSNRASPPVSALSLTSALFSPFDDDPSLSYGGSGSGGSSGMGVIGTGGTPMDASGATPLGLGGMGSRSSLQLRTTSDLEEEFARSFPATMAHSSSQASAASAAAAAAASSAAALQTGGGGAQSVLRGPSVRHANLQHQQSLLSPELPTPSAFGVRDYSAAGAGSTLGSASLPLGDRLSSSMSLSGAGALSLGGPPAGGNHSPSSFFAHAAMDFPFPGEEAAANANAQQQQTQQPPQQQQTMTQSREQQQAQGQWQAGMQGGNPN